jgi:sterol desaturase/sphingolipid hydroxylase (fatty acid hydroxylase superfamily)
LLRGALVAVFAFVSARVPWKLPEHWFGSYVLTFLLLDFVYYWQHRLEHTVPILWAIHAVHHQSIDYNWSVSFRVGVFASLSTVCFHTFLALAGVEPITYASVGTAHAMLLFGLHARTKFTFGPGRFFNAPIFHRVHHASNEEAIDRNFGGVFLVFDRLFGTFTPYREGLGYGVVGEDGPSNPLKANAAPWIALASTLARKPTVSAKVRALFVRS